MGFTYQRAAELADALQQHSWSFLSLDRITTDVGWSKPDEYAISGWLNHWATFYTEQEVEFTLRTTKHPAWWRGDTPPR